MKGLCAAALLLVSMTGCQRAPLPALPAADYRPEQSGTVDHAMCLLGFSATPVRRLLSGHQVIDAVLNGRKATFVLDTGANASVLHGPYAEEFGLSERGLPGSAIGLGGSLKASRHRVSSLRIGEVIVRQNHMVIADLSQLERLLGRLSLDPIHGIVGQDVLRTHRAVIDVARPMLYLRQEGEAAPVGAERCRAEPTG